MNTGNYRLSRFAMMACCAVMLVPIATFFIAGGTVSGLTEDLVVFAPLLLCVGGHLLMHRLIGGLCHGHGAKRESADEEASLERPAVAEQSLQPAHLRLPTVKARQS